jgi:hypothetical protein
MHSRPQTVSLCMGALGLLSVPCSSSQLLLSASEFSPRIISADGMLGALEVYWGTTIWAPRPISSRARCETARREFAAARRAPSLATRAGFWQSATVICRRRELSQITTREDGG